MLLLIDLFFPDVLGFLRDANLSSYGFKECFWIIVTHSLPPSLYLSLSFSLSLLLTLLFPEN